MKSAKTLLEDNMQYVNRSHFDIDRIREYLENHEIIDSELFLSCFRGYDLRYSNIDYFDFVNFVYVPVDRDTFVRRIPFYFGEIATLEYETPVLRCLLPKKLSSSEYESFFCELEWIHYDLSIPLETVGGYILDQDLGPAMPTESAEGDKAGLPTVYSFYPYMEHGGKLMQLWIEYLHLVTEETEEDNFEMMPQCLLTALNRVRVKKAMKPILYKPDDVHERTANAVVFRGQFPLDEDGRPIVEWTSIRLKKPGTITFNAEKSRVGLLRIECGPETAVSVFDPEDPDESEQLVYVGYQVMDFDGGALKALRKEKKISQVQLAEMLDVSLRAVQKWECGDTRPDNRSFVRLMALYEINDPLIFTKVEKKEDNSHG